MGEQRIETKKKKKVKKDSQLVIRINGEERDRFVELCDELDTSAAREIRGFIREFLTKNQQSG
ncbi:hypothetical protein V6575_11250 [Roseibium sp. H3510]|uniref:Ribbon-helix-helix CopG family protein n=2 Tax=Roseibium algae TaxID=3123038 RepID=A0ABU8TKG7_9HYPH